MSKRLGNEDPKKIDQKVKLDDTSTAGTLYVGKAEVNSNTNELVWQIKKVTDTEISFAEGTTLYDKAWDSRTSYSYN